jgi:NAD(P)-dependent dehydrogenase (short-subunit alcohol dehydrogenase family)
LITWASSGIGRATAVAFQQAGFITYATARKERDLAGLRALGCRTLRLDVTEEASMQQAVRTIEGAHGGLDVLVNNAGYGQMGPLEELSLDALQRQFETNVFGLVRLTQLVLPGMRNRRQGRIINVSSMGGEFTTPLGGAYHATKYAVESLSDALRFEVKSFGIEVVVIQPGPIRTRLGEDTMDQLRSDPGSPYAAMVKGLGEMSRKSFATGQGMGTPEQVARVILSAAQAKRPRTRYKITAMAHVMPLLRHLLPDRTWDAMWRRMLKTSTPTNRGTDAAPSSLTRMNV